MSLNTFQLLVHTTGAGGMAPSASTGISARLKRVQRWVSIQHGCICPNRARLEPRLNHSMWGDICGLVLRNMPADEGVPRHAVLAHDTIGLQPNPDFDRGSPRSQCLMHAPRMLSLRQAGVVVRTSMQRSSTRAPSDFISATRQPRILITLNS